MTPWWQGRLAALDLETTGVDVETARIVTAAIAVCGAGEPTHTYTWLIDPGVEVSAEAAAIHGVTTERARAEGDEAGPAISEILTVLGDTVPEDVPLVVFNARFDVTILDREARRHGLNPLGTGRPWRVVDPFVVDKHLDRFRRGSRKLDALCAHYGAKLDEAHNAASDALAAARLAWVIGARGEVVRRVRNAQDGRELAALKREWAACRNDLPALHAAQERWAREQAEGLAAHFASKGEPQHVGAAWPLQPLPARAAA